jgi:sugar (pentulose or hexulose) kinase
MSLNRRILLGVFGATTGFTLTEVSDDGGKMTRQAEIPWTGNAREGIYWPAAWLAEELDRVKADARPGDIIALAMPGADLLVLSPEDAEGGLPANPIQHYRGVMDGGFIERTLDILPAETIYAETGGANVAAFQPYAQLLAYEERNPGLLANAAAVVPLCDWMTWRLSGERGHDPVMLQDQGLTPRGKLICERVSGIPGLAAKIAPWRTFGEKEAVRAKGGFLVAPVTHDSVPARMAGYSSCPWTVWTGTWIGTACQIDSIRATEPALAGGIAFEGAGDSLSAITNVGMLGRTYKALITAAEIDFERASAIAMARMSRKVYESFDVSKLPIDEEAALESLIDRYGPDLEDVLGAVISSIAVACREKISATARALSLPPPREVAVIGGWARNQAFIQALKRFYEGVRIPPQAASATTVGLAAEALLKAGESRTVKEALILLPRIEE